LQEPLTQLQLVVEQSAVTTVSLLHQAATQYFRQLLQTVAVAEALGITQVKQVRADQAAALDHQVQTVIDIV
jgi:hypothetical protein